MKTRKLGPSGPSVSALCLGGNVFGWTADEKASFLVLDAFVESGGNFIDTSNNYSRWAPGHQGGESETVIGKWIKARGQRQRVVIATKVGMDMGPGGSGLSRKNIFESCEASLKRLCVERIDLYISHKDDSKVPLEETLEAYGQLIKQGKVGGIGASNYNGARLNQAMKTSSTQSLPAYQSLQPAYNLIARADFERDLEKVCAEHHLAVTPYSALASGFLTGKYRKPEDKTKSRRGDGAVKNLDPRGLQILAAMDEVSKETGASLTAIAIAWLLSRPVVTAPIASATSTEQLKELIRGCELTLTDAQQECLNQASRPK